MPMKTTSSTGLTLKSVLLITSLSVAACSPAGYAPELLLEEPVVLDEAAIVTAKPARRKAAHAPAKSGVLTAGDIDDTLNLSSFLAYQNAAKRRTKLPMTNLSKPVLANLRDKDGRPAPHVRYTLRKPNASQPFYDGYAGVNGNITVFPAALGAGRLAAVELRAFPEGQGTPLIQTLKSTGTRHQITLPFAATSTPDFLDLTFVVDTTGSMADELDWLTKELQSIVRAARKTAPKVDMRFGLIVYRDHGDDYVVRNYGFTKSVRHMQNWLKNQNAAGGGNYPEAAAAALSEGAAMNWRRGNGERLMFHIADAPAHDRDARAYLEAAASAAAKGVQIFGLGASGVAAKSEYLMRQAAVQTAGRYLFLTDDSGVGHGHAEPTISCYQVSDLTGLMTRVLKSELSGVRIEAQDAQILRRVGSYTAGVCQG